MIISDNAMRAQNWEEEIMKTFCNYLGGVALVKSPISFRALPVFNGRAFK